MHITFFSPNETFELAFSDVARPGEIPTFSYRLEGHEIKQDWLIETPWQFVLNATKLSLTLETGSQDCSVNVLTKSSLVKIFGIAFLEWPVYMRFNFCCQVSDVFFKC